MPQRRDSSEHPDAPGGLAELASGRAGLLLDPPAMLAFVGALVGAIVGAGSDEVTNLRIRYLGTDMADELTVHYRAAVRGSSFDLVATTGIVGSARFPTVACAGGATLMRYPDDPRLSWLSATDGEIASVLQISLGETHGIGDAVGRERLAWVPGVRAALAFPRAVVKLYASEGEAAHAVAALKALADHVPTARLISSTEPLGLVAQERLRGMPVSREEAAFVGADAAALLRVLHAVDGTAVADSLAPAEVLQQSDAPVRLALLLRPDLRARMDRIVDVLRTSVPANAEFVVSHADFNVGQLLHVDGSLRLLDLDTACLADRALDVAAFATNVMSGRREDLGAVRRCLDVFAPAYGIAKDDPGLRWYVAATMLRRVDRPIRRWKRDRSEHVGVIVDALESVLD